MGIGPSISDVVGYGPTPEHALISLNHNLKYVFNGQLFQTLEGTYVVQNTSGYQYRVFVTKKNGSYKCFLS